MKKMLVLLLACMMMVGVMAHHTLAEDDSLQYILDKGELVLGLDASFPPMGFTDEQGEIVGYDIDLAQEVCDRLGIKLVKQPIDWSAKEWELNNKNIDCIWNGMSVTLERQENMNLSLSYLKNEQVLVVRAADGIKTLADLAGKNLGLQAGSSADDALTAAADFKASLGAEFPYEDNTTALLDLGNGGVDAVLLDSVVAEYYITTMQADFVILEETLAGEEYAIGFRKGDNALSDKVNEILQDMAKDGKLAEITTKWFGENVSLIK